MRRWFGLVLATLLVAVNAYGQTFRGAINGTVTDPSGAVVAGAGVKATNDATAVVLDATTTSDGQFSFQDLTLGSYTVTVTASGFSPVTVEKIEVTAGGAYTLPVKLKIGSAGTSVEVSAAALSRNPEQYAYDRSGCRRTHERPRLHAIRRRTAWLRWIFRGRLRFAQRNARQPDELAD